jgi:hypothetical protein
MESLEQQLTVGFLTEVQALKRTVEKNFELNIIPFLEIFDVKEYVELMLKVKIPFLQSLRINPVSSRKLIDIFMHQISIHHHIQTFV